MISPNVIITKNFDTMKRIFFGPQGVDDAKKTSLTDVLESIEEDDATLICAPGNNNTLLEIDYNVPQGSNPNSYINAKFVETKEIIEYFLLDTSPLETQFNPIYTFLSKAGIPLADAFAKLNKYYIAFGTGDDMSQWAGPFAVSLGAANIVLENNVKVVTLGFISGELESIRSYTTKLYGNLGFGDEKLNTPLPKDTEVTYKGVEALKYGLKATGGPRIDPAKMKTDRVLQEPFSWNPFVRSVLKQFLGKIYGAWDRVMVLLPDDFNKIFNANVAGAKSIDFLRNYQGKLREFGIHLRVRSPVAPTDASNRNKRTFKGRRGSSFNEAGNEFNLDEREISFIGNQEGGEALKKYYDSYWERQGDSDAMRKKKTEYMKLVDENFLLTKVFLEMESKIKIDPDEKTPTNPLDPVFEFIGGLKKHQGTTKDYVLFELNDSEILSYLDEADKARGKSYAGGAPGTPRIIFGDVDLIKKLIFLSDQGKSSLESPDIFGKVFTDPYLDNTDWEGYRENFKSNILARERIQNSSFKEKIDFGPFTPEFKEIQDQKDIIFLHGVKNSNVLSVSFQKDIMQGALLNFNVQARMRGPQVNSFLRQAITNDDFKIRDLIDYLENKEVFKDNVVDSAISLVDFIRNLEGKEEEEFSKLEDKSNTNLIAQGRESSNENFDNYINLIVGYKQFLDSYSENADVEAPYANDQNTNDPRIPQTYADLLDKASRLINQISIKTLPFFNQKFYFDKQCYFFSMYNNIVRSTNNLGTRLPTTLLNGSYMIRGARHFMSADEAFSEFDLVKTGPQDNPLLTKTKELLDSASRGQDDKQTPDKVITGSTLPKDEAAKRQQIAKELRGRSDL